MSSDDQPQTDRLERITSLERRYAQSVDGYRATMADIERRLIAELSPENSASVEVKTDGERVSSLRIGVTLGSREASSLAYSMTMAIRNAIVRTPRYAPVQDTPEMLARYRAGESLRDIAEDLRLTDLYGDVRTHPAPDVVVSTRLGLLESLTFNTAWYSTATMTDIEEAVTSRVNAAFDREDSDG